MGDKGIASYAWLAVWALWRFRGGGGDGDSAGPALLRIDAVAGQLRRPLGNAANDLAARLPVLLLILWHVSAKSTANSSALSCFCSISARPAGKPKSAQNPHGS